jgi:hypothetical protein
MNAELQTNNDACGLRMENIKMYPDQSGGSCDLEVISLPFRANIRFFFDWPPLNQFVEQLEDIEQSLSGEATLGQQFEEPYIKFKGNGLGHIEVSGLLIVYNENIQKLEFSFTTDQTAVGPFIEELRSVVQ